MPSTFVSTRSSHDHAPPASSLLQMPNVFVIPPEEEEAPAWCYFDANEVESLLATSPDFNFLDGSLDVFQIQPQAPVFHRDAAGPFVSQNTVIMPRKSMDTRSIIDVLMNDDYIESDDDDVGSALEQDILESDFRGPGNDSEIVEVVKVGRHEEQNSAHAAPSKSPETLRSRASKAFRSLRNVGKGSIRSKPKVQDTFPSAPHIEVEPRNKAPTMSRRRSAIFSQIFSPQILPSHPSASSFEEGRTSIHPPPLRPYSTSLRCFPDSSPTPTLASPTSMSFEEFRSPSPTLSSRTKTNRRRFSMMSLQRMFSFSSADEGINPSPVTSQNSTGPSTSSSSGPDTPNEHYIPLPPPSRPKDYGPEARKHTTSAAPIFEQGEISFEMRLDSLHFDSLSFDADRF